MTRYHTFTVRAGELLGEADGGVDNSKIEKLNHKIDAQYQNLQNTFLDNNKKLKKEITDLNLKIDEHLKNNNFKH